MSSLPFCAHTSRVEAVSATEAYFSIEMQFSRRLANPLLFKGKSLYARVWLGKQDLGDVLLLSSTDTATLLYTILHDQDTHHLVDARVPVLW